MTISLNSVSVCTLVLATAAVELQDLARLSDKRPNKRAAASDHVAFAEKLSRSVRDDKGFRGAGWAQHLDGAADHHKRTAPICHHPPRGSVQP